LISLRPATPEDYPAIRGVVERAFGQRNEANLVEALRANGRVLLELVAESGASVVGHVLYTHLPLVGQGYTIHAAALAPLSVDPPFQNRGIGGALIKMGSALLSHEPVQVIVVLGDPAYYTRFGFSSEDAALLSHPFPPGPHFLVLELEPGVLCNSPARAQYPPEFGL